MKRRDFFKKLGIGIGAIALAPKLLAEEEPIMPRGLTPLFTNQEIDMGLWIPMGRNGVYTKAALEDELKMQKHLMDAIMGVPLL